MAAVASTEAQTIAYKLINQRHPEYRGTYLHELDCLERGGIHVTGNDRVMASVLRRSMMESDQQWAERKARVVYHCYAGEIVGKKLAAVFSDPLSVGVNQSGEKVDPDAFWTEWLDNVAMPGGEPWSFAEHMRSVLRRLLVAGVAYTQVDLPRRDPTIEITTLAQEDALGLRRPYLVEHDPCCVIDWEDGDDGDLKLIVLKHVEAKRAGVFGTRDQVTETFRVFTREDWAVWQITYNRKEKPNGPNDSDQVQFVDGGAHEWGRVPILRHRVQDGLWLMDRIRSAIGDNVRCVSGTAWLRDKINTPAPYLKIQNTKDAEQENGLVESNRPGAKRPQPGEVRILGERDELGFAAPPPDPLEFNAANADRTRDEVYRATDAMEQSIDNSGAALKRSGESKKADAQHGSMVQRALGYTVRRESLSPLQLAAAMRGETIDWNVSGCDEIEMDTAAEAVEELAKLELVRLPPSVRVEELMRFVSLRPYGESEAFRKTARAEAEAMFAEDHEAERAETGARRATAEATEEDPMGEKAAKTKDKEKK